MLRKFGLPLAALAMLVFAVVHVVRAQHEPPRQEPPVSPAGAPEGTLVAGAGLVEAQGENIAVGSHLPGVVTGVCVRVGQKVKAGEELFRLDDRQLRAELRVRQAVRESAKAQLKKLQSMPRPEELPALEARVREAKANLADQEDQAARARRLYAQRAIGDEERVRRDQAARVSREQVARAEADLALMRAGPWKADLDVASAAVDQADAQVAQTGTELDRLVVRAQVDGEVLQVNVRPGEFVGAPPGQALVVLGNLQQMHVRVDIDEHDIPRFRPGLPARGFLRGAPGVQFGLSFVRVEPYVIPKKSLTGANTERVDTRVLQVIYALEAPGTPVYVGQQVDVYVREGAKAPEAR